METGPGLKKLAKRWPPLPLQDQESPEHIFTHDLLDGPQRAGFGERGRQQTATGTAAGCDGNDPVGQVISCDAQALQVDPQARGSD
jgi:hypothetical protein